MCRNSPFAVLRPFFIFPLTSSAAGACLDGGQEIWIWKGQSGEQLPHMSTVCSVADGNMKTWPCPAAGLLLDLMEQSLEREVSPFVRLADTRGKSEARSFLCVWESRNHNVPPKLSLGNCYRFNFVLISQSISKRRPWEKGKIIIWCVNISSFTHWLIKCLEFYFPPKKLCFCYQFGTDDVVNLFKSAQLWSLVWAARFGLYQSKLYLHSWDEEKMKARRESPVLPG